MSHLENLSGKVMKKIINFSNFGDFLTKRSKDHATNIFIFIFRICVKFHNKEM